MALRLTEVKSNCVNNCFQDHDTGLCKGCFRTKREKERWRDMEATERLDTVVLCGLRKDKLKELTGNLSIWFAPQGR